ncbi:MAG TPA: histidine kinase [Candidatus Eisenbergiella merdigallinarum]|uniref:Histidine kinase n=1 Tax=Candidatus Eisenbergiella merdigallinarum TaxID=2838552 RepID=A0A9D2SDT8_9FIRM|nr:histidine kinase [Candidatus Eisenbergiella merdigallinarum]
MELKKARRKYSFNHMLCIYFGLLMLITVCSLIAVGAYSVFNSRQQMRVMNDTVLNIYLSELQMELENLTSFHQDIYADNYSFESLAKGRYRQGRKPEYEYELRSLVNHAVPYYGAIFIFDRDGKISVSRFGAGYDPADTIACNELKERIREYWRSGSSDDFFQWQVYVDRERTFLMYTCRLDRLYLCSIIDLDRFVTQSRAAEDNGQFDVLFYSGKEVLPGNRRLEELGIAEEQLAGEKHFLSFLDGYLIQTRDVGKDSLNICCIMPTEYLWRSASFPLLTILTSGIVVFILILIIFHSFRKVMVYPLDRIASVSEFLEQHSADQHLSGLDPENRILELQKINDALYRLAGQKIRLERENLTRQQEKQQAQLQYLQLQTEPHFFVNCLKSLYNMMENEEYGRMQRMILAFSNHLRYIFHNTLALVTLKAELEEVNHYYNIVLLDRSRPIILTQKIDETLLEERIPPLLIQTFLENSVKYNGRNEEILRFLIQIDAVTWEGRRYMRIRLSDNGVGYSQEVLEKINAPEMEIYGKQHVGIANLKKRLQLIYKTDFQIAFYNEAKGGACTFLCLPLEKRETLDEERYESVAD